MSQAALVDDFLNLAKEYRQAYYDLRQAAPLSWPRYFLFCHSIELVLKAYLAHHGLTEKELRDPPFRHNIKNLLNRAIKCGLSLSANTRGSITVLTEAHTKYWPRYPIRGSEGVTLRYQCEGDADKLFKAVFAALGRPSPF
jgi:HEPN domain-containing protein